MNIVSLGVYLGLGRLNIGADAVEVLSLAIFLGSQLQILPHSSRECEVIMTQCYLLYRNLRFLMKGKNNNLIILQATHLILSNPDSSHSHPGSNTHRSQPNPSARSLQLGHQS